MNNQSQSPAIIMRNLKIIHMAMIFGIAIFAGISAYLRNETGTIIKRELSEILYYISLITVLAGIPLGYWLHSRKVKSLADNPDLMSKLISYQVSHITKIGLFEGSGFISIIVLLLGGKTYILIQVAIVLIIMLLNSPSVSRLITELKLSPNESELLSSI